MIDFLLGFLACALLAAGAYGLLLRHSASTPNALDRVLQVLKAMLSDLLDGIVAQIEALPARLNSAVADLEAQLADSKAALAAEQQAHADHLNAIAAATAAPAPAPPADPAPAPTPDPGPVVDPVA